jgi:hypothetical protein
VTRKTTTTKETQEKDQEKVVVVGRSDSPGVCVVPNYVPACGVFFYPFHFLFCLLFEGVEIVDRKQYFKRERVLLLPRGGGIMTCSGNRLICVNTGEGGGS